MILEREGMEALKTTGMGERTITDINPSEYSASFIKGLVRNNQKEDFEQVYHQYLSPDEIDKLFETIKLRMAMKSPSSKDEDENPQSRYFDGHLLPVINETGGKRKEKNQKK